MTMASNAGFLSTITNIDSIDENQIRQKIHCGELVLVDNNNRTFSLIWSKLRLIADSSDAGKILEGWVACRYCESIFRTHSKLKSDGTRKNYGLTTPTRHLDVCKNYQKELVKQVEHSDAHDGVQNGFSSATKRISRFFFNKKQLPNKTLSKLKEAETKYVVAGKLSSYTLFFMMIAHFFQECILFVALSILVYSISHKLVSK
jgi:hypothetical protein